MRKKAKEHKPFQRWPARSFCSVRPTQPDRPTEVTLGGGGILWAVALPRASILNFRAKTKYTHMTKPYTNVQPFYIDDGPMLHLRLYLWAIALGSMAFVVMPITCPAVPV